MSSHEFIILKTTLRPTQAQAHKLDQAIGAKRFTHNALLAHLEADYNLQKAYLPKRERRFINPNFFTLQKVWQTIREEKAPWHQEVSGDAFSSGAEALAKAYTAYFAGRSRRPRYQKRSSNDSVTFGTNSKLKEGGRRVSLSKVGLVKLEERAKGLAWLVKTGGKLTAVTVRKVAGRYEVALRVKVPQGLARAYHRGRYGGGKAVGALDLGLKEYFTNSDGLVVANPRFGRRDKARLGAVQRKLARAEGRMNGRKTPSKTYLCRQERVQKVHSRVVHRRENFLHQLSKMVVDHYAVVGVEDLHVRGMLRNKRLAYAISDASWASFVGKLSYKLERRGGVLVKVDRWFPSSKACSSCGLVKAKLGLDERVFRCGGCGLILDRDYNAALNQYSFVKETLAPQGYGGVKGLDSGALEELLGCLLREASGKPAFWAGRLSLVKPTGPGSSGCGPNAVAGGSPSPMAST